MVGQLSQGEVHALQEAAERAWDEDTRHERFQGHPDKSLGHCYVTSRWLQSRLGGSVMHRRGHYFWSDGTYALDIVGDHFPNPNSPPLYKLADHPLFEGAEEAMESPQAEDRVNNFISRADREFEALGSKTSKIALDYAGDAFPGSEPQATENMDDRYGPHDNDYFDNDEFKFVYANGELEVSPIHGHDELMEHAGINGDYAGPMATGYISLQGMTAVWQVTSNVGAKALQRVFKDYCEQVGWAFGGLTDLEGEPIGTGSEFAPQKKTHFVFAGGHLYLGQRPKDLFEASLKESSEQEIQKFFAGILVEEDELVTIASMKCGPSVFWSSAETQRAAQDMLDSLNDFASDQNKRLASGWADAKGGVGDRGLKTIEDLETENIYSPEMNQEERQFFPRSIDNREDSGLWKCPGCQRLFPNYHEYTTHRLEEERVGDLPKDFPEEDGGFPELDPDATFPPHFTPQQPAGITTGKTDVPLPEERPTEPFMVGTRVIYDDGRGTSFTGVVTDAHQGYEGDEEMEGDDAAVSVKRDDGTASLVYMSNPFLRAADPEPDFYQHPDPWMDNEPGTVTFPKHWAVVMATTYGETKRVSSLLPDDAEKYFVAYRNGRPVGAAAFTKEKFVGGVGDTRPIIAKQGKDPKDLLSDSVPFIYDVKDDNIYVGHPGTRTSDIPGPFTPGGIVEGTYEPGGKVLIRSMTNMPYTVRHMVELWYYQHPELEVKNVHLQDDEGNDTKLASADISSIILSNVAADPATQQASQALQQAGGEVYAVGGAVRDALMGNDPKDIDLMVRGLDADSIRQALEQLPGRVDLTGKDFGVFRLRMDGSDVEIALPRKERSTGEGSRDFDVQTDPNMSVEEDLGRRDFTANAMAVDLRTGELVDPYGGAEDIQNGVLKTVFDGSFKDDPLRIARALTAHARHGLVPDQKTLAQMHEWAPSIQNLPPERIQQELDKIMASPDPASAIKLARETGVLKEILPEVDAAFGFDQNNPHHELELGDHLVKVLERASALTDDPDVRLAALLHDIGKPASAWTDPETGSNHYYLGPEGQGGNHEEIGADMARERLNQLRFPGERSKRISDLVRHHMWGSFSSPKGARRFLQTVGDHADDLLALREADQGGKTAEYNPMGAPDLEAQRQMIEEARAGQAPTQRSQLAINGSDLINAGIPPGPGLGDVLERLVNAVVEDPSLNTPEKLLEMARTSSEERDSFPCPECGHGPIRAVRGPETHGLWVNKCPDCGFEPKLLDLTGERTQWDPTLHQYCKKCGEKLFPVGKYNIHFECPTHGLLTYDEVDDPWGQTPESAEHSIQIQQLNAQMEGQPFEVPNIPEYNEQMRQDKARQDAEIAAGGQILSEMVRALGLPPQQYDSLWSEEQKQQARDYLENLERQGTPSRLIDDIFFQEGLGRRGYYDV